MLLNSIGRHLNYCYWLDIIEIVFYRPRRVMVGNNVSTGRKATKSMRKRKKLNEIKIFGLLGYCPQLCKCGMFLLRQQVWPENSVVKASYHGFFRDPKLWLLASPKLMYFLHIWKLLTYRKCKDSKNMEKQNIEVKED